jgi:hypothetical protein
MRLAAPLFFVACLASSCGSMHSASAAPTGVPAPVKSGAWGGPHIAMTVAASKTDIEFDCGKATVPGALEADADGVFSATGTFQPERPGPTTPDAPASRPLRVSGTVKGDEMQVHIVLTDQNEAVGDFALTLGTVARLTKCR